MVIIIFLSCFSFELTLVCDLQAFPAVRGDITAYSSKKGSKTQKRALKFVGSDMSLVSLVQVGFLCLEDVESFHLTGVFCRLATMQGW